MKNVKLDKRYDWVGPPDKVSKMRLIRLRQPYNETDMERNYRLAREELFQWNSDFWAKHNELFERRRAEFVANKKKTMSRLDHISAAEMSVFYKEFLNERAKSLHQYNMEWYGRNFALIRTALRVNWFRFWKLLKR